MWLDRAIKWLLPREEHFFELLEMLSRCAWETGALLVECVSDLDTSSRDSTISRIKELERQADRVVAEVYKELNRTFVTPIDRSDIYNLASELEGLTDQIYSTVLQIPIHAMKELPVGSVEFSQLIHSALQEVVEGVAKINTKKGYLEIRKHCRAIKGYEDHGDVLFREQTAHMFETETNPITLLKNKEFLEGLERTLDLCDEVGNVLSTIVIKNS